MQDTPPSDAPYEFIGPDEQGLVRLKMPNLDPGKDREFYCVTVGNDQEAIADAMRRWLSIADEGESR